MNIAKPQFNILWVQVWTLAALQGAITICWVIYNAYVPQLLTQFGFPASFALVVLIIENALAVILEPLMGGLSDKAKERVGSRFLLISAGVIMSATLFIAIPSIVTFVPPTEVWRSLLPFTLIAWAIAMTIFRSPAIALLIKYSLPAELPLAFSVVTLTGGIIGAFRGVVNQFILGLGPIFTFAIASFVLLAVTAALRIVTPPDKPVDEHHAAINPIPWSELSLILGAGFGIGWGSRLLMDVVSKNLQAQFGQNDWLMVAVGIAIAFASPPAGWVATKIGNSRAILIGIGLTIISLLLIVFAGLPVALILIIIVGFSLIINGTIPFALELMPQRWSGLGIGMYFGGFSLAMSLFGVFLPQPQSITPLIGAVGTTLAFLLAGGCVIASGSNKVD
ncbi:MFS transporter [Nostoc sp. CENA543]|uniref:MFS transporter n=1 Tax=Nostoc sp. CENA543 TaxID=1869241 RepID=UPI000CA23DCC|nr:MFS transporter [Nostoc sp. CENA543]AUT03568.1 MFS transporter [Nostoc sp. CENA543]